LRKNCPFTVALLVFPLNPAGPKTQKKNPKKIMKSQQEKQVFVKKERVQHKKKEEFYAPLVVLTSLKTF